MWYLSSIWLISDDSSIGINDLDISDTKIFKDVVNALESLGYKKNHAIEDCKKLQKNDELDGELESVIKKALKLLMSWWSSPVILKT